MNPWKRWLRTSFLLFLLAAPLAACSCEEEPPPSNPEPEIRITPNTWTIGADGFPGKKLYKKFTISNKAESGADPLIVSAIKLKADGAKEFTLIEDKCPLDAEKNPECVEYPSLPITLKSGESKAFTIRYTYSNEPGYKGSEVIITSNGKNPAETDTFDTKVRLGTSGSSPYIDIGLQEIGATAFILPMKKTGKGKPTTDTFTILNDGDADLTYTITFSKEHKDFKLTTSDGADAIGKEVVLQKGASKSYTVTHTPSACGSANAELVVKSDSGARQKTDEHGLSASVLTIKLTGNSPTGATVDPPTLSFGTLDVGKEKTESFTLSQSSSALCELEVKKISFGSYQNKAPSPAFTLGKLLKDGKEVTLPLTLQTGESLKVEVTFKPTTQESAGATILIDTNDDKFDPSKAGVVTLLGGAVTNQNPRAKIKALCAEKNKACNTVGLNITDDTIYLKGESKVKVTLDGSDSYDIDSPNKKDGLTYKWELKVPNGSLTKAKDDTKEVTEMLIDGPGNYELKLTVTDTKGGVGTATAIIKVQN